MRTTALVVTGMVALSVLLVVGALALGFGVGVGQATGQALPVVLAASLLAGLLVELDRRVVW